MTVPATVTLTGLREAAAAALAPAADGDPYVHSNLVDSVEPPAIVLDWDEPWIMPGAGGIPTMGACGYDARLRAFCIAPRLSPAEGIVTLEQLVTYVIARMSPALWRLDRVTSPTQTNWGGVDTYDASVIYVVDTGI